MGLEQPFEKDLEKAKVLDPTKMSDLDRDRIKNLIDVLKHVATLITGTFVLLPAVLSHVKAPLPSQSHLAVRIAMICLALALFVDTLFLLVFIPQWERYSVKKVKKVGSLLGILFYFGLGFLAIFLWQNL